MRATLSFLAELPLYAAAKPYQFVAFKDEIPEEAQTNMVFEPHSSIPVEDGRAPVIPLSIETNGFIWVKHQSEFTKGRNPFDSQSQDEAAVACYLQETAELVQAELGANKVFVFDWRVGCHRSCCSPVLPRNHSGFGCFTTDASAQFRRHGAKYQPPLGGAREKDRFIVHGPINKVHGGLIPPRGGAMVNSCRQPVS